MVIRLNLQSNIKRFRREWKKYPDEIREAIVDGLSLGAARVERAAKLNLTANKSVAFGLLRASIGHTVDPKTLSAVIGPGLGSKSSGSTGNPRDYGLFVEFGRRPGRPPPARVLSLWVKRRLGVREESDNERLAFLISRRIGERGIAPKPFLAPAARREGPAVLDLIERSIEKTVLKLNQRK